MISISSDNSSIYLLLEKAKQLFSDFSIDKVIAFEHDDIFYIVIYDSLSRNFLSFEACGHIQDINALPDLLSVVQEYDKKIHFSLFEQAVRCVEDKLHSKN